MDSSFWLGWLGHSAKSHQRVIGAIRFAAHVCDGKAKIDQVISGKCQRRIIQNLQECAGDQMRFAMTALSRPCVESELMLFRELVAGGEITDPCFAERDIGKRCAAWRLVVNFGTAEQRVERGVVLQRIVHGGAKRS